MIWVFCSHPETRWFDDPWMQWFSTFSSFDDQPNSTWVFTKRDVNHLNLLSIFKQEKSQILNASDSKFGFTHDDVLKNSLVWNNLIKWKYFTFQEWSHIPREQKENHPLKRAGREGVCGFPGGYYCRLVEMVYSLVQKKLHSFSTFVFPSLGWFLTQDLPAKIWTK